MATKPYPLKIENIGEDTYMLMSRGHHDPETFMRACHSVHPSWPMGKPEHIYYRAVPTRREGYSCIYAESVAGARGSFPVTLTTEDYSDERWKPEVASGEVDSK